MYKRVRGQHLTHTSSNEQSSTVQTDAAILFSREVNK